MTQKEWRCVRLCFITVSFFCSSSHPLITWSRCPDKLLSSVPRRVHSPVRRHWYIMKQFMFFSSLTCSVTFPSRAHPASSMIEVIKKVEIMWKLISFDYAKELSKNIWSWHSAQMDVALHGDGVISAMADGRRALNLCGLMWKCCVWGLDQMLCFWRMFSISIFTFSTEDNAHINYYSSISLIQAMVCKYFLWINSGFDAGLPLLPVTSTSRAIQ